MGLYKSQEGYLDLTAGKAIMKADKVPKHVKMVIYTLQNVASLAGFETVSRIRLKDEDTGKKYK